jgi:molybdopterin molybdotransferase
MTGGRIIPAASALVPYHEAREFILSRLALISPQVVALADARGQPLGVPVVATTPVPPHPVAARRGIAVASQDLVGASPYSPAFLTSSPALVVPGDPLPPSTDAVLEAQAVTSSLAMHEVGQTAYPGEGAVLAGADYPEGAVIAAAGATVTPAILLAMSLSGLVTIAVRSPVVHVGHTVGAANAETIWLQSALVEAGCRLTTSEASDLRILVARDPYAAVAAAGGQAIAGIALNPGRDTGIAWDDERLTIVLASRFDAVVAGFHALIMPAIAAMTGRRLRLIERPLAGKLVSQVGFADISLLRSTAEGYAPLATGVLPLEALINADAIGIIAPESEGAPRGAGFFAIPIKESFEAL